MKIFAHRGFSGRYPQNTMLAFKEAWKTGCDGIELDVQLTKDGQVVIIHDEAIDDVTNGKGFVRDYTYEELRRFNAADKWNGKHGFQKIPTFEEYCEWVKDTDLITNVEIKSGVYYYEELEEKTVALVQKYGLSEKILISSFNHLSAAGCKELDKKIRTGALIEGRSIGNPGYYCKKYDFDCYHPDMGILTKEAVENCKAHGIEVNVWTINDMGALAQLYEWGVDGVITNYPDICKYWVDRQREAK